MKTLIYAAAVLICLASHSVLGALPEEEASFLAAVKQAFAKQDTNALFTLTCWDRVPDKLITRAKGASMRQIAREVSDMTLVNADPNERREAFKDTEGVAYFPNLPVTKKLRIVFVRDGRSESILRPVGEKGGKLYLLQNAPVESDTAAKPENENPVVGVRLEKVVRREK